LHQLILAMSPDTNRYKYADNASAYSLSN